MDNVLLEMDSFSTIVPSTNTNISLEPPQIEFCDPNFNETVAESDTENILFNFICYGVLLNVIGIFGILGNVISMVILSRPQMKSSINCLLIGLARCDAVLIVTSMILFGLPAIYPATGYLFWYYFRIHPVIAPVVFPIGMISQTVSVYLTLTVTLERYVAVCHPLRARSLCTCGRARFYTVLIIIFSVLYNVTRFAEATYRECIHNRSQIIVYMIQPTELRNDKTYVKIYIHWMYLIFMYFVPFGFLAILNTAIYRQVRLANLERQRLSRLQKKEIGLATMLLCVVIVFLICNVLALVSNVLEAFYDKSIDMLVELGNLMITINSSVNFVIYVIFGEKFKRLFFKIFFPRGFALWGGTGRESPDPSREDSLLSCNGNGSRYVVKQESSRSCADKRGKETRNSRIPLANSPSARVYYPPGCANDSWELTSTTNL